MPSHGNRVGSVRVGRWVFEIGADGLTVVRAAQEPEAIEHDRLANALAEMHEDLQRALGVESGIDLAERAQAHVEELTQRLERANELRELLAGGLSPETVTEELDGLLEDALERYADGRYRDVLKIARVLAGALLLAYRWRDLVELLSLALAAARLVGDSIGEAWALNEIGVLAGAAGPDPLAVDLLARSRELFDSSHDHAAAETSADNLSAFTPAPSPVAPGPSHGAASWIARHKAAVGGGSAAAAIAAGLAIWLSDPKPDADILAFTTTSELPVPGTFDRERGFDVPANAVDPGETIRACDPLYIVAYVQYSNLSPQTSLTFDWRADGAPWNEQTDSTTWAGPPDFIDAGWAFRFTDDRNVSSGEPIPPGRWDLTVTIDEEVVDEATATLTNSCP